MRIQKKIRLRAVITKMVEKHFHARKINICINF